MISDFLYADGFLTARNEDIIMLSDSSLGSMFSDFLSVDVRRSENIVRNYKPFLVKYGEIDPVTSDIIFMMNNSRKIIKMKFGYNDKRGEMVIVKSTAFQVLSGLYLTFLVSESRQVGREVYALLLDFDNIEDSSNFGVSYVAFPEHRWDQDMVFNAMQEISLFWDDDEAGENHEENIDDLTEIVNDYVHLLVSANSCEAALRIFSYVIRDLNTLNYKKSVYYKYEAPNPFI